MCCKHGDDEAVTTFITIGPKTKDLTGERFWQLTVLGPVEVRRTVRPTGTDVRTFWLCQCDCGKRITAPSTHLRTEHTKSCGCRHEDRKRRGFNRTHGLSRTPEYKIWVGIQQRCSNPNQDSYSDYGARGVSVCNRWKRFSAFFKDMGPRPSPGHTIDRIDVNGNYEPGNCRWATRSEQANNRQDTVFYEAFGRRLTCAQWAAEMNIGYSTLQMRLANGVKIETALLVGDFRSLPGRKKRRSTSSSQT